MKKDMAKCYKKPELIKLGTLQDKTQDAGGKAHSGSDGTNTTKQASRLL